MVTFWTKRTTKRTKRTKNSDTLFSKSVRPGPFIFKKNPKRPKYDTLFSKSVRNMTLYFQKVFVRDPLFSKRIRNDETNAKSFPLEIQLVTKNDEKTLARMGLKVYICSIINKSNK